jgi:cellulose synthase/poly-beta-1,6-N-acetylglucosamine synthase-like glycosyltransferase
MTAYKFAVSAVDFFTISALIGLIVVGFGFLSLPVLYLLDRLRGARISQCPPVAALPDEALPHVLVQLPVFNEPDVVSGLLDAVTALDWPKDKLHIQLLDDSSDRTGAIARAKIAQLRRSGFRADHTRRDHRDGFKAKALAAGLAVSDAPLIAVLDADFRPPTEWLRAVVPRLMAEPRAGFIQSRCEFANADTNWLTRAQGLIFDTHFVMEQGVRARRGMPFQFNGTAAVWRRSAIEEAGGWLGDSLCEDLDLTIRAALAGWHGIFAMNPVVPGLVPDRIDHWRVQQRRWAMGFVQVARKLLVVVWMSDWSLTTKLSAAFLLLYQAVFPFAVIGAISMLIELMLHGGDLPVILPLTGIVGLLIVAVAVGMTLPPYLELRRGTLGRYLRTLITLPPLIFYLAFSNAEPILAALFGRNEVFHRTPKEKASPL